MVFLKLDFTKAYDRVDHSFLWAVLGAMGFDEQVITLVRGLVEQTQSKVHFNESFTKPINQQRGVRQGCPLLSLLFTLTTQPLMALLKQKIEAGRLQGLKIPAECAINSLRTTRACYETKFTIARETIQHYKNNSGALLNIQKSKIIPIYLTDGKYPEWLQDTGCKIAKEREITEYLGCPIGYKVRPSHEVAFLVGKLRKLLCHWTTKSLTILLKHVLRSIHTYHLMSLELFKTGYKEMEKVCRRFLWGSSQSGVHKKALIA